MSSALNPETLPPNVCSLLRVTPAASISALGTLRPSSAPFLPFLPLVALWGDALAAATSCAAALGGVLAREPDRDDACLYWAIQLLRRPRTGITLKSLGPESLPRSLRLCHLISEISLRVCVSKYVLSGTPAATKSFITTSPTLREMTQSGRRYGDTSKPISSCTSRAAHTIWSSSLLTLPLGQPHVLEFHPLTSSTFVSDSSRITAPNVGTSRL
mmetsp:Transcript_16359/g.41428  ORF Transcript_16359/g.41428 Transcript_16359/m.41428 type:complete len:215 (-) Transcript_16359:527-1171(-)